MIDDTPSVAPAARTVLVGDTRPTRPDRRAPMTGSGRGLMIGVLSAVGIVLIALIVTAGWVVRRAADDFARSPGQLERPRPIDVSRRQESLNPVDWISADDYPPEALRHHEEGTVRIAWSATPEGRVRDCHVEQSSGHASLDAAACRAITRSGRYPPVRADTPLRLFSRRVVWKIPG